MGSITKLRVKYQASVLSYFIIVPSCLICWICNLPTLSRLL
jgi:hypothetical protein